MKNDIVNDSIDVILPIYKEPVELVKNSVSSILCQEMVDVRLILILDNPQYEGIDYINELSKLNNVLVIFNEENLGLPLSLNIGIEHSNRKFIARMDADDISEPTRLFNQLKYLKENKVDLIGCSVYKIDIKGSVIGKMPAIDKKLMNIDVLRYKTIMYHPTWFGKASVFKEIKYRNFKYAQDVDFLNRALKQGYRLDNCHDYLLKFRTHNGKDIDFEKIYKQFLYRKLAYLSNTKSDINIDKELWNINVVKSSQRFRLAIKMFFLSINSRFVLLKISALIIGFLLHNYVREQVIFKIKSFFYKL
ncbi:glycosyltransferase, partial [Vibrio parahaemolyticus]|nr:glycosyltransferase [Vibrio parahaemolyticus]